MRILYLLTLSLMLVQHVRGQAIYDMVDPSNQNSSLLYGKVNDSKDVHYLMKYFNTGTIKFSNGASVINIKINYDPITDNVVIRKSDQDLILDKTLVERFSFYDPTTSHTYIFMKFKDENQAFFAEELLACDSFKVYRKIVHRITVSAPEAGYGSDYFKNKNNILNESSYFLKTHDASIAIEKKSDALKAFVTGISLSIDDDLKSLSKLKINGENPEKIIAYFQRFCRY